MALENGHLPGQMGNVTSVVKRAISIKTVDQREMAIVETHQISPIMRFNNE